MTAIEQILKMKRDLLETKLILDNVVLHPDDHEGHCLFAEQLEANRALIELVGKIERALLA